MTLRHSSDDHAYNRPAPLHELLNHAELEDPPAQGLASDEMTRDPPAPSLWLLLLVATCALALRLDELNYVTESLSYEDGSVLLTEAYKLGLKTLWDPFVGYLNTYPRIVALLTIQAPLALAPYIFFLAWLISFYSIAIALRARASVVGNDALLVAFLVAAIALQPTHVTSFFTLITSNIFLAVALAIYACVPSKSAPTISELIILSVASISGPYSTFLLPVLIAQLALLRDFDARRHIYIIVGSGGLIQLAIMLLEGSRSAQLPTFLEWIHVASSFLRFDDGHRLSLAAAGFFWVICIHYTLRPFISSGNRGDRRALITPVICLATAAIFFLLGALANGPWIRFHTPMDMGGHYAAIPYSMIFLAALACTRRNGTAQTIVLCLVAIICASRFTTVKQRETSTGVVIHTNLQWTAFTKFQKVKPDILIPINSALPVYPPYPSVQVSRRRSADSARHGVRLNLSSLATSNAIQFRFKNICSRSNYIGLEIDVWRAQMGFAKVSWGRTGSLFTGQSLSRFYPSGDSLMQFAFYRDVADDLVRLDLTEGVKASAVVHTVNTDPYAAGFSKAGYVVAAPTATGGQVRIREIIVYCLR